MKTQEKPANPYDRRVLDRMRKEAGISTCALAKLGEDENISTEILVKICGTLH